MIVEAFRRPCRPRPPERCAAPARAPRLAAALLCAAWLAASAPALWGAPAPTETREQHYADGTLKLRWEVKAPEAGDPVRHGRFMRYHPNGRPALEAFYADGEPVGTWTWWDAEGERLRAVRYEYGIPVPIHGERFVSPTTVFAKLNGEKQAEGQLKGEAPHGRWRFWHDEGVPRAEGRYLTGVPDGRWVFYHPNGQIRYDVHYQMGVLHGPFRAGYRNGAEARAGRMDQGLKTGRWRYWYRDGRLKAEGRYVNDRQHGRWRFWNEEGEPVGWTRYAEGEPVERLAMPDTGEPHQRPFAPIPDEFAPPPPLLTPGGEPIRRSDWGP